MNNKELSKYYTDENMVRLIAIQVIVLALISLFGHWLVPVLLLTVDFALRAFIIGPSPLAAIAKIIADLLKAKPRPIFAAPKKFAAAVGFIFSLTVLVLFLFQLYHIAYIIGGILILCAILESVFKMCLGCYVYEWIVTPVTNKRYNKNKETTNDD